jgi:tetratricopeptide (TPR) repeat protein
MKRILFLFLCAIMSFGATAQKNQIQNTSNALKFGELDKAKKAIDLAAEHEETRNSPKMWMLRGKTYLSISEDKDKFKALDADAAEKAMNSFINCIKADKDNVYTKEAQDLVIPSALKVYNKGIDAFRVKDYEKSMTLLNSIFEVFPHDKDKALQRNNVTPESLNYDLYTVSSTAGDNAKAKAYLQKLIDVKYKNPDIYLGMSRILLSEKDTANALKYIEQGRNFFDDNQKLITAELNLYIQMGKTNELLGKLDQAISSAPDNELLYYTQGLIYKDKNMIDKAEASYKKAIELKPDYFDANFELGALYFNRGVESANKASSLPVSEAKKSKELDDKATADFKLAIPYLEKAHEQNQADFTVISSLKKLYARTGDEAKFKAMKEKEDKLRVKKQ